MYCLKTYHNLFFYIIIISFYRSSTSKLLGFLFCRGCFSKSTIYLTFQRFQTFVTKMPWYMHLVIFEYKNILYLTRTCSDIIDYRYLLTFATSKRELFNNTHWTFWITYLWLLCYHKNSAYQIWIYICVAVANNKVSTMTNNSSYIVDETPDNSSLTYQFYQVSDICLR